MKMAIDYHSFMNTNVKSQYGVIMITKSKTSSLNSIHRANYEAKK